jgi:hypothetical protein
MFSVSRALLNAVNVGNKLFAELKLVLPRSTYKYSAFTDQLFVKAYSPPAPTVHPTLVSEEEPASNEPLEAWKKT